jgi:ribosome maturation factor RimP
MAENTNPKRRAGKSVAEAVKDLATPIAETLGYFIWDVEYVKEGARRILRITIDNEEGITVDDCEKMHRAIDPVLDEADPIEEAYYLEVSSPGIERDLKNEMHLYACEGWQVEVKLYAPQNGSKLFRGVLCECPEGKIVIKNGDEEIVFESSAVAKISTVFDF